MELKQEATAQAVVSPVQYERLLAKPKAAIEAAQELTSDIRRRVIYARVQEVRVTPTGFKLKCFAGVEQVKLRGKLWLPRSFIAENKL